MLLHELLQLVDPAVPLDGLANPQISGVTEDSRQILPGYLFIARAGAKADGRKFLADSAARGAAAAVVGAIDPASPLPQVTVSDPAAAEAKLAHAFHGFPSRSVKVLGVTGTNGKTTTAYLARHLLTKTHHTCGLIGTVEIDDGRQKREAEMTTPSATDLARLLATMRNNACDGCAMEVSSHALDQGRAAGIEFSAAAFTNLTGDHLDYHKTMENYADAKARLFESLRPGAWAIVRDNDKWSDRVIRNCRGKIVRFGFAPACDYWAEDITVTNQGSRFLLIAPDGSAPVKMSLIGRHNIENALMAAALVSGAFGLTVKEIAAGLSDAAGAPGRLQPVRAGQNFAVLVDYAHTDDALENVLTALRPLTRGTLRVLFGCGGDRDRSKRPRMAAVAEKLADVTYVTSDNPRSEMPLAIITDIVSGFSAAYRDKAVIEPDRRSAIERILADSRAGDIVLIAGKGHENYQIVGTVKHHFDDAEEATRILSARTRAA